MVEFISGLVGNEFLATILMSLVPLVELKGGIVYARGAGIDFFTSFILAYIGSTIVFIVIYFLLRPILNLLKRIKIFKSLVDKIEGYFSVKAKETVKKQKESGKGRVYSERALKMLGVFIFVAIPLPMTGVWTGTAIAVFLDLKFKDVIVPVALGNFIAGLIISALAQVCLWFGNINILDYVLYGLFALAVIMLIVFIVKVLTSKGKSNLTEKE